VSTAARSVLGRGDVALAARFHFLWDRMRSVRHDLAVQGALGPCEPAEARRVVRLLRRMIEVHALAHGLLAATPDFDGHLCRTQLRHYIADLQAVTRSAGDPGLADETALWSLLAHLGAL
jgi:hypothetical protein